MIFCLLILLWFLLDRVVEQWSAQFCQKALCVPKSVQNIGRQQWFAALQYFWFRVGIKRPFQLFNMIVWSRKYSIFWILACRPEPLGRSSDEQLSGWRSESHCKRVLGMVRVAVSSYLFSHLLFFVILLLFFFFFFLFFFTISLILSKILWHELWNSPWTFEVAFCTFVLQPGRVPVVRFPIPEKDDDDDDINEKPSKRNDSSIHTRLSR